MPLDRKYVISAGLVAFVSWALLTDWIPSLRWVPHAFIAGVIATVAGVLFVIATTSKGVSYRDDDATTIPAPVAPAFTSAQSWEEEKAALWSRAEYRRPLIFPQAVGFSRAVDGLLDLILRDYVTSWYGAITKRPLFQHEIDRCIRSVLLTVAARMTNFDLVEIGIARLLPMVTGHMKAFYDAERTVRGKDLSHNVTESEELNMAIAGKFRQGKLHKVASLANADTTEAQLEHLRSLVVKLLPVLLPDNMKSSPSVTVIIREIVSCAVLGPVMRLLMDPDTWNQLIVNYGGPMLQDRKAVRKVRAALDQNAPVTHKSRKSTQFPRIRPYDSERQFERFIQAIRHISTLSEARRFRSEIISQLRRDTAVEGQDAAYLRRLETGKRLLDQKIANLSADGATKPKLAVQAPGVNGNGSSKKQQASLKEVLYDASGLSYFMEYMDRVKLMRLVQFFIVVDGFRGPLEGDNDELSPDVANDQDRMDIPQMYDSYLSKPELQTSDAALRAAKGYLKKGVNATAQDYIDARQAVLQTQTQAYNMMRELHFENFKRSDLYYKWLAIEDNIAHAAVQNKQVGSPLSPENAVSRETSPVRKRRPPLGSANKPPELRRAVLSTTNLKEAVRSSNAPAEARRSLDDIRTRPSLFDDDVDEDRMAESITSLRSYDSDTEAAQDEAKAVNAMKVALDDIVADDEKDSLFSDSVGRDSVDTSTTRPSSDQARPTLSTRSSLDQRRPGLFSSPSDRDKPSIASLGLVGAPSSRGVFVDDLFAEEAEKFHEDEREDSDALDRSDEDQVQEAAPGDLGLIEAIDALNADVEKLAAQKQIVDSLTAKAELTNNAAELRILRKSEQSLDREIKRKEMQKQQYIVQESDNSLYGRAAVSIKSVMIGRENDGHEYALYVIEVKRQAGEQMLAATWSVTRRYSQFHELHKRLRARFPSVRELDFPRRQALFTLQKDFVNRRRVTLERYLRSLLLVPAICRSRELRAFLSQSAITTNGSDGTQVDAKDFVTRIYDSVSDGMEEFLGNIPVLDQLSVAGQNLISAASSQRNGAAAAIDHLDPATHDPATAAEAEAELNAYEAKGAEPFVKPICDMFLETFELSKGTSWLRGRTVVVVLHQLLGGTIERKVREAVENATEDQSLVKYVDLLKSVMWPGGKLRQAPVPRTPAERARSRKEASVILGALLPDLAGSVVGKANAQAASRKIVALLNNQRLNTHLLFTLIDEVIKIVFPETLDKQ
ncbi:tRNA (guanine-N(7)-)-methyltransferase (tRNA(m7G46)-methyltransferase) [Vermiconidia calcicola]|uniref:tRNA (Guanine-N(7)-)-methyltransferase (tRNA(m7G46)-methyltransferase) n=1 Tax=Vermiconidia calcicola TaxID=1690605 RepID=A0ACC3MQN9_9PEZI|nr:tRNA (guanine-N(7)-)-methyltransferase (tRNA(m7G46)-methyltransferase) [Vermiconidia calcicola]